MSILLEALRKSEAQRRLGEVPTLQTPADTPEPERGGMPAWLPNATIALAALFMAWVGWVQYQPPKPGPDATPGQVSGQPVTATTPPGAGVDEVVLADSRPGEADGDVPGQQSRGPITTTAATTATTATTATAASDDGAADRKRDLEQSFQSYADEQAGEAPTEVKRRSVISLPSRDAAPPVAAEQPATATAQNAEPEPEGPAETMSYWQIPPSMRQEMPELRITVLVYAERPDQRFLLVNGQRVREKDDLGNGLVLEEIRRDRAIFSYRNYIFHLKS